MLLQCVMLSFSCGIYTATQRYHTEQVPTLNSSFKLFVGQLFFPTVGERGTIHIVRKQIPERSQMNGCLDVCVSVVAIK